MHWSSCWLSTRPANCRGRLFGPKSTYGFVAHMHEIGYKNCRLKIQYINRNVDVCVSKLLKGPSDGSLCGSYHVATAMVHVTYLYLRRPIVSVTVREKFGFKLRKSWGFGNSQPAGKVRYLGKVSQLLQLWFSVDNKNLHSMHVRACAREKPTWICVLS